MSGAKAALAVLRYGGFSNSSRKFMISTVRSVLSSLHCGHGSRVGHPIPSHPDHA